MRRKVAAEPMRREQPLQTEKEDRDSIDGERLIAADADALAPETMVKPVNGEHSSIDCIKEEEEEEQQQQQQQQQQRDTSANDIQPNNS